MRTDFFKIKKAEFLVPLKAIQIWFRFEFVQEVLFELKGYEAELEAYQKLSEKVRKLFIESGLINRIKFLPATTYQKLFRNQKGKNVDDIVFDYYKY